MTSLSRFSSFSLVIACFDLLACANLQSTRPENTTVAADSASSRVLSRRKRFVIFPEGSNVQLVYCLTVGAYGRRGDLVVGTTAAMAWELPSTVEDKISNLLHRRSRSVLFPKLEAFLQSAGLDGRSCVMRSLCEAGRRDPSDLGKGTFVQELLHAVFTLPNDAGEFEQPEGRRYDRAYKSAENCDKLYPNCPRSIYDVDL